MSDAETSEAVLLQLLIQLGVIIALARIGGSLFVRFGQPQVVGEIMAGIVAGPSVFGRLSPDLFQELFPPDNSRLLFVIGQLGLILLMFLIGLEFDFRHLRKTGTSAASVALAGIVCPFGLGALLAAAIHPFVAPEYDRTGFVLFVATAMSITAIPILGRIMLEFGIARTPTGAVTISAAAIDDAAGWLLLAAVTASVHGSFRLAPVIRMLLLVLGFTAMVPLVVRPVLLSVVARLQRRGKGELSIAPYSVVLVLILASAVATNRIGVFSILGPFILGASLSDQHELTAAFRSRTEPFVTAFFLPVFFVYTGLRTNAGTLSSPTLWLICGLVTLTATAGKMLGCGLAARWSGMSTRESLAVAVMMNTRALMGLIAVSIGRDLGVIPDTVFCMMVLMSVATTLITAPVLRRLQSDGLRPDAPLPPEPHPAAQRNATANPQPPHSHG